MKKCPIGILKNGAKKDILYCALFPLNKPRILPFFLCTDTSAVSPMGLRGFNEVMEASDPASLADRGEKIARKKGRVGDISCSESGIMAL